MKKIWVLAGVLSACFLAPWNNRVWAEKDAAEEATSEASTESTGTDWKQELTSDRDAIKTQRQTMHQNAQAAIEEEKNLLQQIKEAETSGDFQTAKDLRDQLHAVHQENVAGKHQDIQALQGLQQDFRQDVQGAHQEGALPPRGEAYDALYNKRRFDSADTNQDGMLDKNEIGSAQKDFEHYRQGERFKHADANADGVISFDEAKTEKQWEKEHKKDLWKEARERGDAPPGAGYNPPGYNPPGTGPGNPPGYNPPGTGYRPLPPGLKDKAEDIGDRREDVRDRREDFRDRHEDIRDRQEDRFDRREDAWDKREDIADRREDIWDAKHDGGRRDRLEDIRDRQEDVHDRREDVYDRREDVRDRREDRFDRREDVRDRRENIHDRREDFRDHRRGPAPGRPGEGLKEHHPRYDGGPKPGVRDHGQGFGAGKGQGGFHRAGGPGPHGGAKPGGPRPGGHGGPKGGGRHR